MRGKFTFGPARQAITAWLEQNTGTRAEIMAATGLSGETVDGVIQRMRTAADPLIDRYVRSPPIIPEPVPVETIVAQAMKTRTDLERAWL